MQVLARFTIFKSENLWRNRIASYFKVDYKKCIFHLLVLLFLAAFRKILKAKTLKSSKNSTSLWTVRNISKVKQKKNVDFRLRLISLYAVYNVISLKKCIIHSSFFTLTIWNIQLHIIVVYAFFCVYHISFSLYINYLI